MRAFTASGKSLAALAREAGVIGAGGAGFPAHVKLETPVDTVIANGAECEPLLYGDQWLMETRAADIIAGLRLILDDFESRGAAPVKGVVAVKEKYTAARAALESAASGDGRISLLPLPNVYPSGDEHFLTYEATGRIVPEGGIPPMAGALVHNVGTLIHLAQAAEGKPVTGRVMTLGGAVDNPMIAEVPIGAPLSHLVSAMRPTVDDYVVLVNGPMMGRIADDPAEPTTKTMGGLFVLPARHPHVMRMKRPLSTEMRISRAACEACRFCTDFCPRALLGHALEPHKIVRVINYDKTDHATVTSAWLCCECGVCDLWACPMALSPRVIYRAFKKKLKEAGIKNPHTRNELTAEYYRPFRGVPVERLVARLGLAEFERRPGVGTIAAPDKVILQLDQNAGAPAEPCVSKGSRVHQGDVVADIPKGKLGARVHASIGGTVMDISARAIVIQR